MIYLTFEDHGCAMSVRAPGYVVPEVVTTGNVQFAVERIARTSGRLWPVHVTRKMLVSQGPDAFGPRR